VIVLQNGNRIRGKIQRETDALVVVVSEETGKIAVVRVNGGEPVLPAPQPVIWLGPATQQGFERRRAGFRIAGGRAQAPEGQRVVGLLAVH